MQSSARELRKKRGRQAIKVIIIVVVVVVRITNKAEAGIHLEQDKK